MTKLFALWVIFAVKTTGAVEVRNMDMTFTHSADCQYAATYFNANAHKFPQSAEVEEPFYYCQIKRSEGNL